MASIISFQSLLMLTILVDLSLFGLIFCSRLLIDGSISLAHRYKISPLIIGTTIIGMGTSIDELVVNLNSLYLPYASGIIMGNIVGSNIVNLLLGLGIPALIIVINASEGIIKKEILIYSGLSLLTTVFIADSRLTKSEGFIFLGIFFAMLLFIRQNSIKGMHPTNPKYLNSKIPVYRTSFLKNLLKVAIGLSIMLLSARVLVISASEIALRLGVSSYIISLMIVGLGTSLPEIMASIQAAIRKNSDIVIGNVFGSNIFNLCFGLGVPMIFKTIEVSFESFQDIYFLNFLSAAVIIFLLIFKRRFSRRKNFSMLGGLLLISGFVFFMFSKFLTYF